MNYRVEYTNQNWIAADIEASSPLEAAKLYLRQDADSRWQDYDEVAVFWGRFGKERQSFPLRDLLAACGSEDGGPAMPVAPPVIDNRPAKPDSVTDPTGPFVVVVCVGLLLVFMAPSLRSAMVPVAMGLTTYFSYKRGFNPWFWVFAGAGGIGLASLLAFVFLIALSPALESDLSDAGVQQRRRKAATAGGIISCVAVVFWLFTILLTLKLIRL